MDFQKEKQDILNKEDKSKKSSIDEPIKPLIDKINSLENYYTTSSCSGRVVLLEKKSDKKNEVNWIFKKHSEVGFEEIKNALNEINNEIWFKFEPAILHVACRTVEGAQKMLDLAFGAGFKRSGIISSKKVVLEIGSSEVVDTIICKDKILIDDKYLKVLIDESNKKMRANKEKIDLFFNEIQNL